MYLTIYLEKVFHLGHNNELSVTNFSNVTSMHYSLLEMTTTTTEATTTSVEPSTTTTLEITTTSGINNSVFPINLKFTVHTTGWMLN